ncbi:MAG: helix-turn-helix domain-containing protein [Candidatus Paceibacterota bacterium]
MPENDIRSLLIDGLKRKHLTPERLQGLTEVPMHYLDSLLAGDWADLPARPYVRGYLIKIARELDLDEDDLLDRYQNQFLAASGSFDSLPGNRFALPSFKYRKLLIPFAVLVVIIYAVFFTISSRTPYLELVTPPNESLEPYAVNTPEIVLEGSVEEGDNVFINGDQVEVDSTGTFQYPYTLSLGLNTIEFRVSRFLGKEIRVITQVFFERTPVIIEDSSDDSQLLEATDEPASSSVELDSEDDTIN